VSASRLAFEPGFSPIVGSCSRAEEGSPSLRAPSLRASATAGLIGTIVGSDTASAMDFSPLFGHPWLSVQIGYEGVARGSVNQFTFPEFLGGLADHHQIRRLFLDHPPLDRVRLSS